MSEQTIVHLLRHGEVHNPDGVLYGRRDGFHLSELGRTMAQRVADTISDRDIVHLVASPLDRTRETIAPLAAARELEVHPDQRVIESTNVFEGETFGGKRNVLTRPSSWRHLWNPFKPSWGEPYKQVVARMTEAIHDAREAAAGHEAVDEPVAAAFPEALKDGAIDRPALKQALGADPAALKRLESIVHPLVAADRRAFVARHSDAALVVLDIPLLFEGDGQGQQVFRIRPAPALPLQGHRDLAARQQHRSGRAFGGQGGMGEVYQARDTKRDRDVALKVLVSMKSEPAARFCSWMLRMSSGWVIERMSLLPFKSCGWSLSVSPR